MKWDVNPTTGEVFSTKPQPGDYSGRGYDARVDYIPFLQMGYSQEGAAQFALNYIISSTRSDLNALGMTFTDASSSTASTKSGKWLVALTFNPDSGDYHWWRRNADGTWFHKPGTEAVMTTDYSGNVVYDPASCNRRGYTVFGGYFVVGP